MTRKGRRLTLIGAALAIVAFAAGLALYALSDSIVFFYGPSEVLQKNISPGTRLRIGGLVKAGSLVKSEGQKAAPQLKRPHVSILNEVLGAVSGTDAQEGEIVPAGKSLKMPAGVGDTVHLME